MLARVLLRDNCNNSSVRWIGVNVCVCGGGGGRGVAAWVEEVSILVLYYSIRVDAITRPVTVTVNYLCQSSSE